MTTKACGQNRESKDRKIKNTADAAEIRIALNGSDRGRKNVGWRERICRSARQDNLIANVFESRGRHAAFASLLRREEQLVQSQPARILHRERIDQERAISVNRNCPISRQ